MDHGEMEGGITWKELFRVLKDKAKNGSHVWADLLLMLFEEGSFFSQRKNPGEEFSIRIEATSKRALDCFFERAWEKSILKSRND
jgi:hypothetical protein